MNILITGGTGFIGSRLALRCLERGDKVRVLGETNTRAEEMNRHLIEASGGAVLLGSILDDQLLEKALAGIEVVFHLAAIQHEMNIPDSRFRQVNVEGTHKLLETALHQGVRRIVHGSTIGVYGHLHGTIDESSPCSPDNIYGVTKLEGERLALSYADRLPVTVARIPEVYGPGDRRLLKLFKAIWKSRFFVIGAGDNLHHPIFVDDLIDGFFLLEKAEEAVGELFLLTGPEPVSTRDMVDIIGDSLCKPVARRHAPQWPFMAVATLLEKTLRPLGIQPPLHRRRMDFFIKSFQLSSEKARGELGFTPKTSFSAGVKDTADWYRGQGLLPATDHIPGQRTQFVRNSDADWLSAKMEPFDSFWEAPDDIEKGYDSFGCFYRENYLPHVPTDRNTRVLVISCGPGYFVNLLKNEGYSDVIGIDSDPAKVAYGQKRGLNCQADSAFSFLEKSERPFDLIFAEQELNHLTKDEMVAFLELCREKLTRGGRVIVHSLNGANPITGAEALAQNFDHFNSLTEYSLKQVLHYAGFCNAQAFPLNLYVFYRNPLNYVALLVHALNVLYFRFNFKLYGKSNKIFTKKIAAVAYRS